MSSGLPSVDCTSTAVGSESPAGNPLSSTLAYCADWVVAVLPEVRSNVGWKPKETMPSTPSSTTIVPAKRPGCRPRDRPIAANRAAFGSVFQAFDGQKTRVPSSETTAGTSVSPAVAALKTAMARAGPSSRKSDRLDSVSARNAIITAPAAVAMAGPTRAMALSIACLEGSPARSRSRYRNSRNRM